MPPTVLSRRRPRRQVPAAALLATAALLSGCADLPPARALRVATGFTSHHVCSDTFVSGMDPAAARDERISPMHGLGRLSRLFSVAVDTERQEVRTSFAGGFAQRARFAPAFGCTLVDGDDPVPATAPTPAATAAAPPLLPSVTGDAVVVPADPALRAAIDLAFEEPDGPHQHQTKAVVVLQDGRVVGERYAAGTGPQTPWLGFSMTKSLTNALLGVLVRQGRLRLDEPAGFPGWAADERRGITLEHLLRQTSGLDLRQDNSGFDTNSRMLYLARDMAAFAAHQSALAAPGTRWHYTDGHFVLLGRRVRDAIGPGADPAAVRAFAERELFGPLGMRHMTLEFDTAGSPQGASFSYGSARDWARFGQLYLDDGVAGGVRLLPEGWVALSRRPTLDTGYGAGWYTNVRGGEVYPEWGVPWGFAGAPADAFFARGFMGNFTLVVPSRRVVIVRLGISHRRGDDIEFVNRMVTAVLKALPPATGGTPPAAATARGPG